MVDYGSYEMSRDYKPSVHIANAPSTLPKHEAKDVQIEKEMID